MKCNSKQRAKIFLAQSLRTLRCGLALPLVGKRIAIFQARKTRIHAYNAVSYRLRNKKFCVWRPFIILIDSVLAYTCTYPNSSVSSRGCPKAPQMCYTAASHQQLCAWKPQVICLYALVNAFLIEKTAFYKHSFDGTFASCCCVQVNKTHIK